MSSTIESTEMLTPAREAQIDAAALRSRQLLHRRALAGAFVSSIPIPGLDWAFDAALLSRLMPRISQEFGLSAAQIDALEPSRREGVQKAVAVVGSVLIGKLITREMIVRLVQKVATRMAAKQLGKFVPIVGTAAAAAMGYAALRYLGEQRRYPDAGAAGRALHRVGRPQQPQEWRRAAGQLCGGEGRCVRLCGRHLDHAGQELEHQQLRRPVSGPLEHLVSGQLLPA